MKDTLRVLVAEKLPSAAVEILEQQPEITAEVRTGLSPEELKEIIGDYHGIIIRSATKLRADVLEKADNLQAIVRAGVGVDNIDVDAASRKGIIVMNTPSANTISTAEHTVAMLLSMVRNIPQARESMVQGKWDRKSFTGTQVSGKIIGIVGLGRVGLEVARRCRSMDMTVLGYDPYISRQRAQECQVELCKLDDIYERADFITVHTPLTDDTAGLIGAAQFERMKPGVRIINCARGGIVDETALAGAIREGKVAGAALDVFTQEPPVDRSLIDLPQVVATPHLGASTEEAQLNVAMDAARQMADALANGLVTNAINLPALDPKQAALLRPFCLLAEQLGALQQQLIGGGINTVSVTYSGEIAKLDVGSITRNLLVGLLKQVLDENVNLVNAPVLAQSRGISVTETKSSAPTDFTTLISLTAATDEREMTIDGTVFGKAEPRIVSIDNYRVEMVPRGDVLVVYNEDRPGLIGEIGTLLGKAKINISGMANGRREAGGDAITVLNVEGDFSSELLEQMRSAPGVLAAHVVHL